MSSPTIRILGMMEIDDKYQTMIALKHACENANVDYPKELTEYFGREDVYESELELKHGKFAVKILAFDTGYEECLTHGTDQNLVEIAHDGKNVDAHIYDIHLDRLPQVLKTLRVEVGW